MPKSSKPRKRALTRQTASRRANTRGEVRPQKTAQKPEPMRHVRRVPLFPGRTGGR